MATLKDLLPKTLHTDRLVLDLFDYSNAHYDCLLAAMNSSTAHSDMGDYGIKTPLQFDALNINFRLSPSACKNNVADIDIYYLLRPRKDDSCLIGGISILQLAPFLPPDIGWCIQEPFMGHGYATEAGREVLRMAREILGIDHFRASPGIDNRRSIRVAQKIGFIEGGTATSSDGKTIANYVLPCK